MNDLSRRGEAPFLRPLNDGHGALMAWLLAAILAILGATAYCVHEYWALPAPQGSRAPVKPGQLGNDRLEQAKPGTTGAPSRLMQGSDLPALKDSDEMVARSLSEVVGTRAFRRLAVPEQLVRRIVATVDNLPRPTAPRRVMPFNPVPGALLVLHEGPKVTLDEVNSRRYRPYVNVFLAIDIAALVERYVRAYPLFQRAYAELGYPEQQFHQRLLAAIDDMLAAPELDERIQLVRPKVLYEFADPDLEARSAGQKVMIRMGLQNEMKVKAKLRQLREALIGTAI